MRRILKMRRADLLQTPAGAEFNRLCFSAPRTFRIRMHALDAAARTHGVEYIKRTGADEWAEYLNTGDIYAPTIIYWRGNYRVQSIGDFVETLGRRGVHFE